MLIYIKKPTLYIRFFFLHTLCLTLLNAFLRKLTKGFTEISTLLILLIIHPKQGYEATKTQKKEKTIKEQYSRILKINDLKCI